MGKKEQEKPSSNPKDEIVIEEGSSEDESSNGEKITVLPAEAGKNPNAEQDRIVKELQYIFFADLTSRLTEAYQKTTGEQAKLQTNPEEDKKLAKKYSLTFAESLLSKFIMSYLRGTCVLDKIVFMRILSEIEKADTSLIHQTVLALQAKGEISNSDITKLCLDLEQEGKSESLNELLALLRNVPFLNSKRVWSWNLLAMLRDSVVTKNYIDGMTKSLSFEPLREILDQYKEDSDFDTARKNAEQVYDAYIKKLRGLVSGWFSGLKYAGLPRAIKTNCQSIYSGCLDRICDEYAVDYKGKRYISTQSWALNEEGERRMSFKVFEVVKAEPYVYLVEVVGQEEAAQNVKIYVREKAEKILDFVELNKRVFLVDAFYDMHLQLNAAMDQLIKLYVDDVAKDMKKEAWKKANPWRKRILPKRRENLDALKKSRQLKAIREMEDDIRLQRGRMARESQIAAPTQDAANNESSEFDSYFVQEDAANGEHVNSVSRYQQFRQWLRRTRRKIHHSLTWREEKINVDEVVRIDNYKKELKSFLESVLVDPILELGERWKAERHDPSKEFIPNRAQKKPLMSAVTEACSQRWETDILPYIKLNSHMACYEAFKGDAQSQLDSNASVRGKDERTLMINLFQFVLRDDDNEEAILTAKHVKTGKILFYIWEQTLVTLEEDISREQAEISLVKKMKRAFSGRAVASGEEKKEQLAEDIVALKKFFKAMIIIDIDVDFLSTLYNLIQQLSDLSVAVQLQLNDVIPKAFVPQAKKAEKIALKKLKCEGSASKREDSEEESSSKDSDPGEISLAYTYQDLLVRRFIILLARKEDTVLLINLYQLMANTLGRGNIPALLKSNMSVLQRPNSPSAEGEDETQLLGDLLAKRFRRILMDGGDIASLRVVYDLMQGILSEKAIYALLGLDAFSAGSELPVKSVHALLLERFNALLSEDANKDHLDFIFNLIRRTPINKLVPEQLNAEEQMSKEAKAKLFGLLLQDVYSRIAEKESEQSKTEATEKGNIEALHYLLNRTLEMSEASRERSGSVSQLFTVRKPGEKFYTTMLKQLNQDGFQQSLAWLFKVTVLVESENTANRDENSLIAVYGLIKRKVPKKSERKKLLYLDEAIPQQESIAAQPVTYENLLHRGGYYQTLREELVKDGVLTIPQEDETKTKSPKRKKKERLKTEEREDQDVLRGGSKQDDRKPRQSHSFPHRVLLFNKSKSRDGSPNKSPDGSPKASPRSKRKKGYQKGAKSAPDLSKHQQGSKQSSAPSSTIGSPNLGRG